MLTQFFLFEPHVPSHIAPSASINSPPEAHLLTMQTSQTTSNTSAASHLTTPPAASSKCTLLLTFSAYTLRAAPRFCKQSNVQLTSYPICSQNMPHNQDHSRQSLHTSPPSPLTKVKLAHILTWLSTHPAPCLSLLQPAFCTSLRRGQSDRIPVSAPLSHTGLLATHICHDILLTHLKLFRFFPTYFC